MAMLVVITDREQTGSAGAASLDAVVAHRLAEIGVTNIAIAVDDATEAIVLEGWAFDAVASGAEATSIVVGDRGGRALQPVFQTLLSPSGDPGRSHPPVIVPANKRSTT